ncbi:kinesin-domain-containing protein, partial [Pseudovirgaria hyperparasitica]
MSVRVVARIRPLLKLEIEKDVIVTAESVGNEKPASPTVVRIPNPKNGAESFSFQFNSVYEQHATQQDLFDHEIAPTVKHLFNGFDTTIFAYGVTGTGKTHTMRGGKSLAERGVIPRLLSKIYREQRKIEKSTAGATEIEVAMSYYEIYNDKVFDLFEPPEKRTPAGLPIRDNNGKTVVVGLTERPCTTLKEFEQLYDQANVNRSTSATKLNAHSSRSHAVLCVKITQTTETSVRVSRASAIDLAGSEDNRRTDNNKERLVESSSINKSLFVLAQCVEAISKKQTRIPYRESKMTRILSLGQNNGLTIMILNLAPVKGYHLDTLSSLNFANRTKKIEVCEVENEPVFRSDTKSSTTTSSIAGKNIQRQPLRALATAHNIGINKVPKSDKPVKEFSVYSDSRKLPRASANAPTGTTRRSNETQKRPAEQSIQSRPSKAIRPAVFRSHPSEPVLSAAAIEAMIDAKLSEKFAERAISDVNSALPALPPELQQRLLDLERRVEASTDKSKEEGLHFLMMAKQHQARGEDTSALKMYRLAVPYFPDNEKLERKIAALDEKIREAKLQQGQITKEDQYSEENPHIQNGRTNGNSFQHQAPAFTSTSTDSYDPTPSFQAPAARASLNAPAKRSLSRTTKPKSRISEEARKQPQDDPDTSEFIPNADLDDADENDNDNDDAYTSDSSIQFKKRKTSYTTKPKQKRAPKVAIFRDSISASSSDPLHRETQTCTTITIPQASEQAQAQPPPTPRTTSLLSIINSRDIKQIRALRGVGAKRAETIV